MDGVLLRVHHCILYRCAPSATHFIREYLAILALVLAHLLELITEHNPSMANTREGISSIRSYIILGFQWFLTYHVIFLSLPGIHLPHSLY
ncbi:hypothetical protein BDV41DRAFT_522323 [Aspergillus transmontanensis]|uniref:Uncharacterized protein n=1 Tax=Aspergillus transmontanensis TaxID=1034304 RepID=A0A5N6WHD5_9EURO|nr:hypothetical protein BDV41DRAFT_522323 [Aspergillus transmontanensis]